MEPLTRDAMTDSNKASRFALLRARQGQDVLTAESRLDALMSATDTAAAVANTDPLELYDLVHEVGLNDCLDLVLLATPEQIQTFVDLDVWRRDGFLTRKLEPWLQVALQMTDPAFEKLWQDLDPEILPLYLKEHLTVWLPDDDGHPPPVPDEETRPPVSSPDFAYWIQYPEDEDASRLCRALLERIYDVLGVETGWLVMEATRWEIQSAMEESAYRFRTARLEDFGFRPLEEALEVLSPLDPLDVRRELKDSAIQPMNPVLRPLPGAWLQRTEGVAIGDGFLRQCIDLVPIERLPIVETQLVTISNMAASAIGVDASDRLAVARLFEFTMGVLNIGLEFVCEGSPETGAHALVSLSLRRLFRAGYGILTRLQQQVRDMDERGNLSIVDDLPFSMLDDHEQDLFRGLSAPRPFRSLLTVEPFRDYQQVEQAAQTIASVAFREVLFFGILKVGRDALAGIAYNEALPLPPTAVRFGNLFATLAIQSFVTGEPKLEPVAAGEVPRDVEALEKIFEPWSPERLLGGTAVPAMTRHAKQFVNAVRDALVDELVHLESAPEPQFTESVLLRQG